jgi:cell division protein FtsB
MHRRGELEVVINTRWLERALWLLLLVIIIGLAVWLYTGKTATTDATTAARVAELEQRVTAADDTIAKLTQELTEARAHNTRLASDNQTNSTPVTSNTTNQSLTAPPQPPTAASLDVTWEYEGDNPSATKYKLRSVSVTATNTHAVSKSVSYALCWSSIECTNAVSEGTFSVGAGTSTTRELELSIPTFVDITQAQRLKLVITSEGKTLLSDERIIR